MNDISQVRAAVQYAVIQICAEEDGSGTTRMTPRALAALSELTYQFAVGSLSNDLDDFSSHANRKTITDADVKLAVRKNPEVLQRVQAKLDDYAVSSDVLFAAARSSKKVGNNKKRAAAPAKESSSSSSSEEEFEARRRPVRKKHTKLDMFDSSDEDCLLKDTTRTKTRKPVNNKRTHDDDDSDSSIEVVQVQKKQPPKARFRMPAKDRIEAMPKPTQSRVDEIMANMSMDSCPSDDDC